MMATEKTNTLIAVEGARVVITHDKPVGTQYLTPEQARAFAKGLVQAAEMVERGQN